MANRSNCKTPKFRSIDEPWEISQDALEITEIESDQEDLASFARISIPLIRRVYPQLIANQIFSVQPLSSKMPSTLEYYVKYR